jgi:crotonobetainyl-CoA:carnitine CoA-transferase CaiB-like acyl-CoA transferase
MEGREPVKLGVYAPLFLAGAVSSAFSFGAFMGARRSGRGERVDISIMEVLAGSMDRGGTNLLSAEYTGALGHPIASTRTQAPPTGAYPCKDGYFFVNASIRWWDRLCRLLNRPDLIDNPTYVERLDDPSFGPEIDKLFLPWALARTKREVMFEAQAEGLGAAAIYTMEDVVNDPHLRERNFFQAIDHPATGSLEYFGAPFQMLGPRIELRPAPLLGQHTVEVLTKQLGYSHKQIVLLHQRNII